MPDPAAEAWTIRRLLSWTTDFFAKRGFESPRLEAEVLLAHVLDHARYQLYMHIDDVVSDAARSAFRDLVKRRSEGEPSAYLVGRKEFYALSFKVTPAVLIPRPDTEFLVIEALEALGKMVGRETPRLADVGTGSGCLAVAVARRSPQVRIVAIDRSAEALAVARENAQAHGVADRIDFCEGDLFEPLDPEDRFDLIVSNPPYVATPVWETLEPTIKNFEPRLALDGGIDGLDVIRRLVDQAAVRLHPGGTLAMEIGSDQGEAVTRLFAGDLWSPPTIRRDHAGLDRVVTTRRLPIA